MKFHDENSKNSNYYFRYMLINFGFISQRKSQVRSDWTLLLTNRISGDEFMKRKRQYQLETLHAILILMEILIILNVFNKVVLAIENAKLISSGHTRYILRISKIGYDE